MKKLPVIALILLTLTSFAQNTEFAEFPNGLIYSDATIRKLKFIVDSLNLKFKVCDLEKAYLSNAQARAHYVRVNGKNARAAMTDMENGMPFDELVRKYARVYKEKDLLVIRYPSIDDEGKAVTTFRSLGVDRYDEYSLRTRNGETLPDMMLGRRWFSRYDNDEKEAVSAFYFLENFSQKPITENYARMIRYADCLVDTSARIYHEKALSRAFQESDSAGSKVGDLMEYVEQVTHAPALPADTTQEALQNWLRFMQVWDSLRVSRIDSVRKTTKHFDELLDAAVMEAMGGGGSNTYLEQYVELYRSKKLALDLKRSRSVTGKCSMDSSPRLHAQDIARLSAETVNWEIFLRAHLDIMNDRFDRLSDGSYAQGMRKTYIRELEVLDINVPDLMMGITLRAGNLHANHYYGSISRLGRSLSESKQAAEMEALMLRMIADDGLDDYNRALVFYLFRNFHYYLAKENVKNVDKAKLRLATNALPPYLVAKMKRH